MAITMKPMAAKPPNIKIVRKKEKSFRVKKTIAVMMPNSPSVATAAEEITMAGRNTVRYIKQRSKQDRLGEDV